MTAANKNIEKRSFRLENSTLFRECEAERQEILKHKWLESEKLGKDIGFEFALIDWVLNHRDKWRSSRSTAK